MLFYFYQYINIIIYYIILYYIIFLAENQCNCHYHWLIKIAIKIGGAVGSLF